MPFIVNGKYAPSNLNEITETGVWPCYPNQTANYPGTNVYPFGAVLVLAYDESWRVMQVAYCMGDNAFAIYARCSYHNNGARSWSGWRRVDVP